MPIRPVGNSFVVTPSPSTNSEPEVCPKCHKTEDIKQVCRHCGHEYVDEGVDVQWYDVVGFVLILLVGLYIVCTLIGWLIDFDNRTLVEILKSQWNWLLSKRIV